MARENFVLHDVQVYVHHDQDGCCVELFGKNRLGEPTTVLVCEGDRDDMEKVQVDLQDTLQHLALDL